MVEIRRGGSGDAARERLPWLEPVEDEDDYASDTAGYGGLILAAILVLLAIALLTAAVLWYRGREATGGGTGQIIKAEPGPYKVRPDKPGGMTGDPGAEVTYGTSAGQDIDSPIDLGALPEQPMTGQGQARSTGGIPQAGTPPQPSQPAPPGQPALPGAPKPAPSAQVAPLAPSPSAPPVAAVPPPAPKPATPPKPAPPPITLAPAEPATATGGGGGVVQLGAFSTDVKARAAWKSLSARFGGLKELGLTIAPVVVGDKTLYRLRGSGASNAAGLCARLRVAGESCTVVN